MKLSNILGYSLLATSCYYIDAASSTKNLGLRPDKCIGIKFIQFSLPNYCNDIYHI